MADSTAFLAHILSQTRQNINFLVAQNQLSRSNGNEILAKLPTANDLPVLALSQQSQRLLLTPDDSISPPPEPEAPVAAPLIRRGIAPPPQRSSRARALWDYNERGQDPNDLSFRTGDVIEIITETNEDWWTGRLDGRQGLFPSKYVEKINPAPSPSPSNYPADKPSYPVDPLMPTYTPPGPYQAPPGGYQPPAPNKQGVAYNPYMSPPVSMAQQNTMIPPTQEQPPVQPAKASRFGGMGNTLAQSAAGGVGFGAGSAIGSGIINSIF